MPEYKETGYLFAMLKMCDDIETYGSEFGSIEIALQKRMGINAVLMNLSQIGEFTGRIGEETRAKYSSIDWKRIKNFRNVIVHDYFGVDVEKVRSIIETDVPELTRALVQIISNKVSAGEIEQGLVDAANRDMKAIKISFPK
jgi:uncharacterized protein with HEPN domain